MPFLLRKIRKARWYGRDVHPYLDEGDAQADSLLDLLSKDNQLSAWYIEDDGSNLERVVTALAANSDSLTHLDYALFDHRVLSAIDIKIKKTAGPTPDESANAAWHLDLIEPSARKLIALALEIFTAAEKERVPEKKISEWITRAVANGQIDKARLKGGIVAKIGKP